MGRSTPGPLRRLLVHVREHRRYALLTVAFGALGFLLSFAYPWIIGTVVDLLVTPGSSSTFAARQSRLFRLTELAFGAAILHAAVVYGRGHYNVHLGNGIVTDIRRKLFAHLQTLSVGFYTKERTGSLLSRVLHDVQAASAILYMGIIVAGMDAIQLAIAIVLLASINFKLTLACILVFPLYALVFTFMNPRVRRVSEKVNAQLGRIAANMAEQLSGQSLIKTYTAEQREIARFSADVARHHDLVVAQSHEGHLVASSSEVFVHLGTTIVIGLGGWLVMHGEMTPGMMTRFLGYVVIMYGPVRRFAELNITYQTSMSALRRVFRVFDIQPAVVEPERPHRQAPTGGAVAFEGVRFRYSRDDDEARAKLDDENAEAHSTSQEARFAESHWVLDGIDLEAAPGERVAIVGPSGAGKTTLVSLIPRLYDATSGHVRVDGIDVREYALFTLRSSIAIVQQDSFVFTGTVRDNIAYGRPHASMEEIVAAAKAAHAHEFIARFSSGYGERLGERGVNLSGGQRQRISIARALLKNPRVLILDEATSSLDAESEAIVQQALERLMRNRTCFVIAHRLSTIRNADRIVVIDGGRVAETGTHSGLLGHGGTYARLVRTQTAAGA